MSLMEYIRVRKIIYLICLHFVYNTSVPESDLMHFEKMKSKCLCRPLVAGCGLCKKRFPSIKKMSRKDLMHYFANVYF